MALEMNLNDPPLVMTTTSILEKDTLCNRLSFNNK